MSEHADYLYAYAISRISDEEQARDLVQETFLAALEKVDKFEGKSSERTWLTAILRNKIIDVYRKKSSDLVINRCHSRPSMNKPISLTQTMGTGPANMRQNIWD